MLQDEWAVASTRQCAGGLHTRPQVREGEDDPHQGGPGVLLPGAPAIQVCNIHDPMDILYLSRPGSLQFCRGIRIRKHWIYWIRVIFHRFFLYLLKLSSWKMRWLKAKLLLPSANDTTYQVKNSTFRYKYCMSTKSKPHVKLLIPVIAEFNSHECISIVQ